MMSTEIIHRPNRAGEMRVATAPRRADFLAALARIGTFRGAARAVASPKQLGEGHDCVSAWHTLRRADPLFAAACDDCLGQFLDALHERARSIAMGECTRPARYEGRVVGHDAVLDTGSVNLLLRLLEKHDSNWAQHRKYEHLIKHDDNGGEAGLVIRVSEFSQLSDTEQTALKGILVTLRGLRAQQAVAIEQAEAAQITTIDDDGADQLSDEDAATLKELTR